MNTAIQPDFAKYPDGLVPAIIQDAVTLQVLMLGYMDEEAFSLSRKRNRVTFFSRSKQRLWTKGETSGNFLYIVAMDLDCDQDAILIKVKAHGPTCHRGTTSCFD
jgi:phosphoribosyl-ATP pyrophosphohydrolase/phosphoribosyl-AMP cyclohydrolase